MGLFDYGSETPKVFKSKAEISEALSHISSLDHKERPQVMGALIRVLDGGGVTVQELKEVVRELRKNGVISDIDRDNLLHLADPESSEDES